MPEVSSDDRWQEVQAAQRKYKRYINADSTDARYRNCMKLAARVRVIYPAFPVRPIHNATRRKQRDQDREGKYGKIRNHKGRSHSLGDDCLETAVAGLRLCKLTNPETAFPIFIPIMRHP